MTRDGINGAKAHRLITISVPVFNEEGNIARLLERLGAFAATEPGYAFEFLFTDNASTDRTFELLAVAAAKDSRIRVLRFSRNFGFQNSIYTNLLNARGVAAVQIDADLQDPPEIVSEFLRKWEAGYSVVYGIRRKREEHWATQMFRRAGYWLINHISEVDVPRDAGDFRLVDRQVIEALRGIQDRAPYLRGLIAGFGFKQIGVPYERTRRIAGRSKFNFWRLVRLGFDGIASQSSVPLQIITFSGVGLGLLTIVVAAFYFFNAIFHVQELPPGFTTIVLLLLVSMAVNVTFLGFMGEYVGRIYLNTRGMPMTIIADRIEPMETPDVATATEHATPARDLE